MQTLTILDRMRKPLGLVRWNQWNRVVQDHRTGEVDLTRTNEERLLRGLAVPWSIELAQEEMTAPAIE